MNRQDNKSWIDMFCQCIRRAKQNPKYIVKTILKETICIVW